MKTIGEKMNQKHGTKKQWKKKKKWRGGGLAGMTCFNILVITWTTKARLRWFFIHFEIRELSIVLIKILEFTSYVFIVNKPNYWSIFVLRPILSILAYLSVQTSKSLDSCDIEGYNFHVLCKSWFGLVDGVFGLRSGSASASMTRTNHQFELHTRFL